MKVRIALWIAVVVELGAAVLGHHWHLPSAEIIGVALAVGTALVLGELSTSPPSSTMNPTPDWPL